MSNVTVFTKAEIVAILGADVEKQLRGVRSSSRAARRATDRALVALVGIIDAATSKEKKNIKAAAAQVLELTAGSLSAKLTYARKVMGIPGIDLDAVIDGHGLQAEYAAMPKEGKPSKADDASADDASADDASADDMGDMGNDDNDDPAHRAARILSMLDKASAIVQAAHELAETVDDVDPDAVYRLTNHVARLARFAEVSIQR